MRYFSSVHKEPKDLSICGNVIIHTTPVKRDSQVMVGAWLINSGYITYSYEQRFLWHTFMIIIKYVCVFVNGYTSVT